MSTQTNSSNRKCVERSGFIQNERRGTGFVFTAQALKVFLENNQLSHLIRAHELQQSGASVNVPSFQTR